MKSLSVDLEAEAALFLLWRLPLTIRRRERPRSNRLFFALQPPVTPRRRDCRSGRKALDARGLLCLFRESLRDRFWSPFRRMTRWLCAGQRRGHRCRDRATIGRRSHCGKSRAGDLTSLASAGPTNGDPHSFLAYFGFRAGLPTTVAPRGTSRVTTAPAPIIASSPIATPGRMMAPPPIQTFCPIDTGRPNSAPLSCGLPDRANDRQSISGQPA